MISTTIDRDLSSSTGNFIVDSEAFINKINNILSVNKGEVVFYRDFGTNLEYYLFQPYSYINSSLIVVEIKNSILRYYPQAEVEVDVSDLDYSTRIYNLILTISHPILGDSVSLKKDYQSYV